MNVITLTLKKAFSNSLLTDYVMLHKKKRIFKTNKKTWNKDMLHMKTTSFRRVADGRKYYVMVFVLLLYIETDKCRFWYNQYVKMSKSKLKTFRVNHSVRLRTSGKNAVITIAKYII